MHTRNGSCHVSPSNNGALTSGPGPIRQCPPPKTNVRPTTGVGCGSHYSLTLPIIYISKTATASPSFSALSRCSSLHLLRSPKPFHRQKTPLHLRPLVRMHPSKMQALDARCRFIQSAATPQAEVPTRSSTSVESSNRTAMARRVQTARRSALARRLASARHVLTVTNDQF